MVGMAPSILRVLSSSQEHWAWEAEENEEGNLLMRKGEAPSGGNSRLPRSRDQECRRIPAGRCHRAVRCEALKKRSRIGQKWEQMGLSRHPPTAIPLCWPGESSSTQSSPAKTSPAKDPVVLLSSQCQTSNTPSLLYFSCSPMLLGCCQHRYALFNSGRVPAQEVG